MYQIGLILKMTALLPGLMCLTPWNPAIVTKNEILFSSYIVTSIKLMKTLWFFWATFPKIYKERRFRLICS